jgi:ADP-L-glycero-D-manno-heptose 6-epimerase
MEDRIVITGGAGFIGSGILWALNREGLENIVLVDQLDDKRKEKNIAGLRFSEFIDKDDFLSRLIDNSLGSLNIDTIFHLGACSSTTERDLNYLLENNYNYSRYIARFSLKNNIRLIYASSAATYGDGYLGFDDSDTIESLSNLKPLNYYGCSKQWFDIWARYSGALNKMVGLKYFNVYGPNEYHKGDMRSFVLKAYQQIKEQGEVRLFKSYREGVPDGGQIRDFIYLKDAVKMSLFFFKNRALSGIYNIGTAKPHSFNQLVSAVFKALGLKPNIKYIDMPQNLREQYQYFTKAETLKIERAGYKDSLYDFDLAVADYVKNYIERDSYLRV